MDDRRTRRAFERDRRPSRGWWPTQAGVDVTNPPRLVPASGATAEAIVDVLDRFGIVDLDDVHPVTHPPYPEAWRRAVARGA